MMINRRRLLSLRHYYEMRESGEGEVYLLIQ
jgi:hypothetical protein